MISGKVWSIGKPLLYPLLSYPLGGGMELAELYRVKLLFDRTEIYNI
jgi:hypothetical protein